MAENKFGALVQLIVDKAQAKADFQKELKELEKIAKVNAKVELQGKEASLKSINTLANAMASFRDNNTKMTKDMKNRLNDMYNTLINGANISQAEVDDLRVKFSKLKLEVRDAGRLGKSFGDSIKSGMASFSTWLPASQLIMSSVNGVRNMITSIKDLDTALVDLQKTTDATAQQLEDFYYASNETAKRLGATTEEVINAASAWSRLGYSIKDAQKMSENSSIFVSISPEMDIDTARVINIQQIDITKIIISIGVIS